MKIRLLSAHDSAAYLYALSEIDFYNASTELDELRDWLELHCQGQYQLDNLHLFIKPQAAVLFNLRWFKSG